MGSLLDFRDIGNISSLGGEENLITDCWEIETYKNLVYIATKQGLISYDRQTRLWKIIFRSNWSLVLVPGKGICFPKAATMSKFFSI